MGYRWKPSASQRAAYREKMLAIEEAQREVVSDGYDIPCRGDVCKGDMLKFYNPAKSGEALFGEVVRESYGADKQQHTFSIDVDNDIMRIKGRNLYKHKLYRKPWKDEEQRKLVLAEKHERGNKAREVAKERKEQERLNHIPEWALEASGY